MDHESAVNFTDLRRPSTDLRSDLSDCTESDIELAEVDSVRSGMNHPENSNLEQPLLDMAAHGGGSDRETGAFNSAGSSINSIADSVTSVADSVTAVADSVASLAAAAFTAK